MLGLPNLGLNSVQVPLEARIVSLFANGEQGAWYDPSNLSTLYQDAAGTTPVTALGQAVGLMLDKSKGLVRGPELVVNGGFDDPTTTGWTTMISTISVVDGVLRVEATPAANGRAGYGFATVIGRSYELSLDCVPGTSIGGAVQVRTGVTLGAGTNIAPYTMINEGPWRCVFTATTTSSHIDLSARFVAGSTTYFGYDNISVRELPGNHASQSTDTARPVLAAGNKIDYDGVDDKLTTTFPDLGTAVTIVRSVPGTGASILTGQTIGAGAWDDSTDHHGLLIINRALTVPETALVTRWANLRAGV